MRPVNSLEFSLREFNTGSFPTGLSFMLGSMAKWIYGGDPTEELKFEGALAEVNVLLPFLRRRG